MPLDQFGGAIDGFRSPEHFGLLDGHGEVLPVQRLDLRQRIHALAARVDEEAARPRERRSEEHTSELQSLMRISYAVFCLKKKTKTKTIEPSEESQNKEITNTRIIQ